MKRIGSVTLILSCLFPLYAFADTIKPPEIKISGYTQIGYIRNSGSAATGDYQYKDNFEIMRARFTFKAAIDPMASLNVQIDPAIKDVKDNLINILTDAYFDLGYLKGHNIRLGQFKLPFGLENPIPDSRTFPVNASIIKGKTINTRDIGIDISAKKDWYEYHVGVINGNGSNKKDDNSRKDFVISSRFTSGIAAAGVSAVCSGGITPAQDTLRHAVDGFIQITPKWGEIDFEYIKSRFYNSSTLKTTKKDGWYAMIVPQLNERTSLTLRYEKFDPDNDAADRNDEASRTTAGLIYNTSKYSKIKINYEWRDDDKVMTEGDVFTFMWQTEY